MNTAKGVHLGKLVLINTQSCCRCEFQYVSAGVFFFFSVFENFRFGFFSLSLKISRTPAIFSFSLPSVNVYYCGSSFIRAFGRNPFWRRRFSTVKLDSIFLCCAPDFHQNLKRKLRGGEGGLLTTVCANDLPIFIPFYLSFAYPFAFMRSAFVWKRKNLKKWAFQAKKNLFLCGNFQKIHLTPLHLPQLLHSPPHPYLPYPTQSRPTLIRFSGGRKNLFLFSNT